MQLDLPHSAQGRTNTKTPEGQIHGTAGPPSRPHTPLQAVTVFSEYAAVRACMARGGRWHEDLPVPSLVAGLPLQCKRQALPAAHKEVLDFREGTLPGSADVRIVATKVEEAPQSPKSGEASEELEEGPEPQEFCFYGHARLLKFVSPVLRDLVILAEMDAGKTEVERRYLGTMSKGVREPLLVIRLELKANPEQLEEVLRFMYGEPLDIPLSRILEWLERGRCDLLDLAVELEYTSLENALRGLFAELPGRHDLAVDWALLRLCAAHDLRPELDRCCAEVARRGGKGFDLPGVNLAAMPLEAISALMSCEDWIVELEQDVVEVLEVWVKQTAIKSPRGQRPNIFQLSRQSSSDSPSDRKVAVALPDVPQVSPEVKRAAAGWSVRWAALSISTLEFFADHGVVPLSLVRDCENFRRTWRQKITGMSRDQAKPEISKVLGSETPRRGSRMSLAGQELPGRFGQESPGRGTARLSHQGSQLLAPRLPLIQAKVAEADEEAEHDADSGATPSYKRESSKNKEPAAEAPAKRPGFVSLFLSTVKWRADGEARQIAANGGKARGEAVRQLLGVISPDAVRAGLLRAGAPTSRVKKLDDFEKEETEEDAAPEQEIAEAQAKEIIGAKSRRCHHIYFRLPQAQSTFTHFESMMFVKERFVARIRIGPRPKPDEQSPSLHLLGARPVLQGRHEALFRFLLHCPPAAPDSFAALHITSQKVSARLAAAVKFGLVLGGASENFVETPLNQQAGTPTSPKEDSPSRTRLQVNASCEGWQGQFFSIGEDRLTSAFASGIGKLWQPGAILDIVVVLVMDLDAKILRFAVDSVVAQLPGTHRVPGPADSLRHSGASHAVERGQFRSKRSSNTQSRIGTCVTSSSSFKDHLQEEAPAAKCLQVLGSKLLQSHRFLDRWNDEAILDHDLKDGLGVPPLPAGLTRPGSQGGAIPSNFSYALAIQISSHLISNIVGVGGMAEMEILPKEAFRRSWWISTLGRSIDVARGDWGPSGGAQLGMPQLLDIEPADP